MLSMQATAPSPFVLKFRPPQAEPDAINLRAAYTQFLLPRLKGQRADGTLEAYETAIKHWENLTPNPDVRDIDDSCLDQFRDSMAAAGHGVENVKKQWRSIRAILWACCPRNSSNKNGRPKGEALLDDVPCFEISDAGKKKARKRVVPDDVLLRIYEYADAARYPRGKLRTPGDYWRAITVFFATYGPRRDDGLLMDVSAIHWGVDCPDPEIRLSSPWGWLEYVPEKTKRKKPDPLILPLTQLVRAHLEFLADGTNTGRLFPVGMNRGTWREVFNRIQEAAGIPKPYYTFQELRKTANVRWNELPKAWRAGEDILGHAPRGVNARSYDEAVARLCRLVNQFALPDGLGPPQTAKRQLTLFD